jgi:hypothetical protein
MTDRIETRTRFWDGNRGAYRIRVCTPGMEDRIEETEPMTGRHVLTLRFPEKCDEPKPIALDPGDDDRGRGPSEGGEVSTSGNPKSAGSEVENTCETLKKRPQ